jgi:hypothetical protein
MYGGGGAGGTGGGKSGRRPCLILRSPSSPTNPSLPKRPTNCATRTLSIIPGSVPARKFSPVLLCPGCSPAQAFPRCSRTQGVPVIQFFLKLPRCSRGVPVAEVFSRCPRSTSARSQGVPNVRPHLCVLDDPRRTLYLVVSRTSVC